MVNYRRVFIPGATYFFMVNLQNRQSTYLIDHIDLLRESFIEVKNKKPYKTDAIVVLPDHLHSTWTLPKGDVDYADHWRQIKSIFTKKNCRSKIVN